MPPFAERTAVWPEWCKLLLAAFVFFTVLTSWFAFQKWSERHAKLPPAAGGSCSLWFVGSSTMHKWTTLPTDMAPWRAYNRGVNGATIQAVRQMFANEVSRERPRAIVLYLGDNDIADGLGTDTVVAELRGIIAIKRRLYGNTPTFVISIKPSPGRIAFAEQQRSYNRQAAGIASDASDIVFVDVARQFLVNGRPGDFYAPDGVHLNAAGYTILTRGVHLTLSKRLSRPGTNLCGPQRT